PIRNVVVHRAFPFAKAIAAGDAAPGLLSGRFSTVLRIDLAKLLGAHLDAELVRILARNIEELQMLVGHGDMRRALSGAAQIFQQRIDRRGLRLDHPKSADIGAKIIEQLRAPVAAGGIDMALDEATQMLHMRPQACGGYAMNIDRVRIVAIDKSPLNVE